MEKVLLVCTGCGYQESREREECETLDGTSCPNCDEDMNESELPDEFSDDEE